MKIAVIGGSGFIGTQLCKLLSVREGIEFIILDKVQSSEFPDKWKLCDVLDVNQLSDGLKGVELVVNLAAEHKDNVRPTSLYYDVNVEGQKNICMVMDALQIRQCVFTSSVAVYGFVKDDTDENGALAPFNHYGKSKLQAEKVLDDWFSQGKTLTVIRPTVVFGEGNRGNVYNLLKQIATGRFVMVGSGKNLKSMAYVENIASFIEYAIKNGESYQVVNYVDKPDFNMNDLVAIVNKVMGRNTKGVRMPYLVGLLAGYCFDLLSFISGRSFAVSSIRVKKFCATTQFCSANMPSGFKASVSLQDAVIKTVKNEFK